jgi:aspartate ammonia-lyase
MNPNEVFDFLQSVALFSGLEEGELRLLCERAKIIDLKEGDHLFEQNEERESIDVVVEGDVELYRSDEYGGERRLSFFTQRDFLGEGCLFDDSPHATGARAVSDATILRFEKTELLELFKRASDAAMKIYGYIAGVMSRRMQQANTRNEHAAAQYSSGRTRVERDSLGGRLVPAEHYYGVQTLRARENFHISGVPLHFYPTLIVGLAMVKKAAALANRELGRLDKKIAEPILQAAEEIIQGRWHMQFVVDMIQGGAGTSTNMNANEVIANRALEILGYTKGQYERCHPNNHVNLSQSTNDVYPTAVKIALIKSNQKLVSVLRELIGAFRAKGKEFARVIKMGRTQLQDAVPMTLGREFESFAVTLEEEISRLSQNARLFLEVNLGGTAIGTSINVDPRYPALAVERLREVSGEGVVLAHDLVEATQDTGSFVMYSSALKRLAVKLSKICNDLRLLSSGPRAGLNEINLPQMQPGSSIMPGKVNPVIPEVVNQIAFKVIGNDLTVALAAEAGQLQLNVMEPIIVQSIFESIEALKNGMQTLRHRCVEGITANEDVCLSSVERSVGLVTALNPEIGYEKSAEIAKEALKTGKSVYELALEKNVLPKEKLDELLDPRRMIGGFGK